MRLRFDRDVRMVTFEMRAVAILVLEEMLDEIRAARLGDG